ncbi:MAG: hypothetical protein AB7O73_01235 [Bacteroidia bacterium]
MEIGSVIDFDKGKTTLLEDGIVETTIYDGKYLECEDLIALKNANMKLTGGKEYGVLFDTGELTSLSKETRELAASKEFAQNTVAMAILIRNLGHKLIANFFINVNKPHITTKVFTNKKDALVWLRGVKRKN